MATAVKFYGTRGSLPTSPDSQSLRGAVREILHDVINNQLDQDEIDEYLKNAPGLHFHGGNTSCVRIEHEGQILILDAGSGIRQLGKDFIEQSVTFDDSPCHILFSHAHWDHICGFPFFVPLYNPQNKVNIVSSHEQIETALRNQQQEPCFPVPFEALAAQITFRSLPSAESIELGPFKVKSLLLSHPNQCYGYRIEVGDNVIVYMTDTELPNIGKDEIHGYQQFVKGAALIIGDCQYTFPDNYKKRTWGHSSVFSFIDLCRDAEIETLAMFHHEPSYTDAEIDQMEDKGREYLRLNGMGASFRIVAAYDGLELTL